MTNPDQQPWAPDPDRRVGTPPSGGIGTGSGGERGTSVFDGNATFREDGSLLTSAARPAGGSAQGYNRSSAGTTAPLTPTGVLSATSLTPAALASVTFTANLDSVSSFAITGVVTFLRNGVSIGTATLDGSEDAVFVRTAGFSAGTHTITATYPGNTRYSAFTTNALTVTTA